MSALLLSAVLISPAAGQKNPAGSNWPSFRGPNASGIAEGFSLPTTWDATTSKNILWKTPIPGLGHSSPIVWGNRIYVSTAISGIDRPELKVGLYGDIGSVEDRTSHRWIVYCLDRLSGKIIWGKTVYSGVPKIKRHPKSTHANTTLATDGRHLVAFFGSEGLHCFDMDGKPLWTKDLGLLDSGYYVAPEAQWEFGSSPIIYRDRVLIQCDVLNGSFIAALNVKDGSEVWRTPRNDVPTWGTPTVYDDGKQAQMIINGYRHIGSYDVNTGTELWRLRGGGDIPVPTPVVARDMVFITNAHGTMAPIYAIRLNAIGDISLKANETSNEFVAWSTPREGAYMITPIVYGDYLYSCKNNGVLYCYEAGTGKKVYQERLGDGTTGFTAAPVAGDAKIYFSSEDGDIYVVKAGSRFEILSKNPMGEICMASPAISGGVIYFRTKEHVVAVSARP
ncbi:MAG: PQQ-binding-like beta-propeller repeat protein [Acidobacteriia bacterium]|nr:PQQ-binding-like beta-propeller repeat protein [Terriglobia bacterium]